MSYKAELQSNNTDLQTVLSKVNALPDQLVLPALNNPAGAENIESGFQALSGAGEIIEGTLNKGLTNREYIGTCKCTDGVNVTTSSLTLSTNYFSGISLESGDILICPVANVIGIVYSSTVRVSSNSSYSLNMMEFDVYRNK